MGYLLNIARKFQTPDGRTVIPSLVVNNKPSIERNAPPSKADITPGEIVEPGANTKAIWRNPYPQGTKEARIKSLTQIMGAIFQESFKKVQQAYEEAGVKFKSTPEILNTEQRIEALQSAVLNGEAKINDFQLAAYEWEKASKAILN